MFKSEDKVLVIGPAGSAQAGRTGKVKAVDASKLDEANEPSRTVTVQLDGEDRPRNFKQKDLNKV